MRRNNKMVIINKNILKKLMAIADANGDDDYFYIKHYVIDQLKNCNGYDDDALYDFLFDVNVLKDEILEEEEELNDWLEIEQEKREWLDD